MAEQVVGQPSLQESAVAGAGAAANPFAVYGLNADGTPLTRPATQVQPGDPEKAQLTAKVADLEAKLASIPETFAGLTKKVEAFDRLINAIRGDDAGNTPQDQQKFGDIWRDLKQVAHTQAPGVAKLLNLLETDPQYLERLQGANQALMAQHVVGLNERAHIKVLELAKKAGFKGTTESDLEEMVYPFEQTLTQMIDANPEMRRAFLSGHVGVIEDVFHRLIKPHVAQRLRDKQNRLSPSGLPKAPPRGAGQPGSEGDGRPKRDLSSPQGRANFHREAVDRWMSKGPSGRDDA